jgi:hypothetical protein
MNNSELFQQYNHLFWTEKIIEQLNNQHPELIAFEKKIPGFHDSIKNRSEQVESFFQKNTQAGIPLSECIDQSFQLANLGLHVSVYYLLQDIIYKHANKEADPKNLIALSAYIRQYTGLFIEEGFPDTPFFQSLFVLAVKIGLLPTDEMETKLVEWEGNENLPAKVLIYNGNG